jgi:hypothetical protein
VSAEVVHKQVVSVVNKEMQCIQHVTVVLEHGDLQSGLDYLLDFILSLFTVVNELNALLLVLLPQQVS